MQVLIAILQLLTAVSGTLSPEAFTVYGLPGGELMFREMQNMEYSIAISIDGMMVSEWVTYPQSFNPAKSNCVFDQEDMTLEVQSQMPYTANYTFALYSVDESWNMELIDQGAVDYYDLVRSDILSFLDAGQYDHAYGSAMEIMYPGSMPYSGEICSAFVLHAAEIGTLEAFDLARDVSFNLMGVDIFDIATDSQEYESAIMVYADLADPETAAYVRERLGINE